MSFFKQCTDILKKTLRGNSVPKGLFELVQYFRNFEPINFSREILDGEIIAKSTNFRYGSIITSAKTNNELENNIVDAILTAFDVPSTYKKEAL